MMPSEGYCLVWTEPRRTPKEIYSPQMRELPWWKATLSSASWIPLESVASVFKVKVLQIDQIIQQVPVFD